ncbi:ABC transporter substrate-binding protein [Anaerosporobacter sp.]|uniref:ABC transporter substrate-binding protein n=1 Tax=Anaerosporobacter sp. TaxID=1872529 RepID=UPI00286F34D5|nr:ABC transporter substrate-binding protein [Anaerosporobacter sp.]
MKLKKVISSALCVAMATVLLAGCANGGKNSTSSNGSENAIGNASENVSEEKTNSSEVVDEGVDLSKHVTLSLYLYGSPGVANADILAEINRKLKEDINTSIEIKYIDWGDIATKYPLLWAAGESFDMAYSSVTAPVPYYTLAKQGSLYDISKILDKAPTLKAAIPETSWAAAESGEGIYGVPTLGAGYTVNGFVYNKANCTAWGIEPVTDLKSLIAYCDASVAHDIYPFNGNAEVAMDFYKMLVDSTGNWVPAPGVAETEMYLVAKDYNNVQDIIHPAFTDEFANFVTMLDEWEAKGYWSTDILSAQTDDKEMYKNLQSSAYITHMADWTGNYTAVHGQLENQDIDAWYFAEDNNKVMQSSPAQDMTVINTNSKYPERCLLVIEKLMTDESYYRLFQYGIEGRQYDIVDGYLEKPASFDDTVDGGGFAGWAFSNSAFQIPSKSEHPSRYEKLAEWSKNFISNPYNGFIFSSSAVAGELSAISNVNSTLGIQLMLGKTNDVASAIEEYRSQLKKAGVDVVIDELKSQLQSFTSAGK